MKIKLNDTTVTVTTQRSMRARKTLDMEFTAPDRLKVTIPSTPEFDLETVIKQNMKMLERKHREYLTRTPILQDGRILVNGEPRELIIDHSTGLNKVELNEDQLIVHTKRGDRPGPILKEWMAGQTRVIVERVQEEYGLEPPPHLRVVDTARWGYVRDKTIHFNNQLAALQPKLQTFIVVHEHLHLQHMNHGPTFQRKLKELIPDYASKEHMLTKYLAMDYRTINNYN